VRFSLRNEDWSKQAKSTSVIFCRRSNWLRIVLWRATLVAFLNLCWNIKSFWSPGGQRFSLYSSCSLS